MKGFELKPWHIVIKIPEEVVTYWSLAKIEVEF